MVKKIKLQSNRKARSFKVVKGFRFSPTVYIKPDSIITECSSIAGKISCSVQLNGKKNRGIEKTIACLFSKDFLNPDINGKIETID
jgi:hypothetical protein